MPPTHAAVENVFPIPGDVSLKLSSEAGQHIDKARSLFVAIKTDQQPQFAALANLIAALCWELRYLRVNLVGIATLHQQLANSGSGQLEGIKREIRDMGPYLRDALAKPAGD